MPIDLGEAAAQSGPVLWAGLLPDGSFALDNVPSGTWDLTVNLYGEGSGATAVVIVPADESEPSIDIGTLAYRRGGTGMFGELAPDTLGTDFDGTTIAREEYIGRWLVIALWDSCSGQMTPGHAALLDALASDFEDNADVALLSLNQDQVACSAFGLPIRPATLDHPVWRRAFVPPSDFTIGNELGFTATPRVAIVGPKGSLMATDLAPAEVAEVLGQLRRE